MPRAVADEMFNPNPIGVGVDRPTTSHAARRARRWTLLKKFWCGASECHVVAVEIVVRGEEANNGHQPRKESQVGFCGGQGR